LSVTASSHDDDISALAKGGRTNVFGFLLRLAARIPFLIIGTRYYGPEALGRFAIAVLAVEFIAQLATLGLRRGLAEALSREEKPESHVVADALLIGMMASAIGAALLIAAPQIMYPNSDIDGFDRFLPIVIFAIVATEIALAALAYRFDIASAVRARAVVEPWTISIMAGLFALPLMPFYSLRDGLIIAYILAMLASMVTAFWPLVKSYGRPHGWHPDPANLWYMARRNMPLAAADAVEWGSRRLDLFILGIFASPAIAGIYYTAQQLASLPQKLKTSFDPILGPVITSNLKSKNYPAIAKQVGQVGFWIIAAQAAIALAIAIPGEAVMGLFGPQFVGGAAAMAFLLAAEVAASTAVVSESALVYIARHRNLLISLGMLALQALLSLLLLSAVDWLEFKPEMRGMAQAAAVAMALMLALAVSSFVKVRLLSHLLAAPVGILRWALMWAVAAATVVGFGISYLPEWAQLTLGVPAILAAYCAVIWTKGFGDEDRKLFRKKPVATPAE
jgi:O-antigen/teichoic acid export membrane protein